MHAGTHAEPLYNTIISIETVERHNPRPALPPKNQRKHWLRYTFSYDFFTLQPNCFVLYLGSGYVIRRFQYFFFHFLHPNRG